MWRLEVLIIKKNYDDEPENTTSYCDRTEDGAKKNWQIKYSLHTPKS